MAKQKTPQELYKERKEKEESERTVCLPPGLVNHGNTCFMNSVLQGLIATHTLQCLFQFSPIPYAAQQSALIPIASRRSPLLTNGHGMGGQYEQNWEAGMPIGDIFSSLMHKSWNIQANQRRENLSPRDLLNAVGQKYDQYLDFRQQDAHEFLRQLLDAMRMEELDIIKKRQPPPPKPKRIRRRSTMHPISSVPPSPSPLAAVMHHSLTQPAQPPDPEEKLESFADMIFGGRLTSLLVCQKCKHVSHTYEDFNDLSLSIKPEDYAREKKRDKLKTLAKKFKNLHGTTLGVGIGSGSGVEMHRSSSVPASPRGSADASFLDESAPVEPRRRSLDLGDVDQDQDRDQRASPNVEADTSGITETYVSVTAEDAAATETETESDHKTASATDHIGFLEPLKVEKKEKKTKDESDGWAKFGRRVSMTVGLSKNKDGSRRSRSVEKGRGRRSIDKSGDPAVSPLGSATSPDVEPIPALPTPLPRLEPNRLKPDNPPAQSPSPTPTPPQNPIISPPLSSSARFNLMSSRPTSPAVSSSEPKRSKSPQPPKATPEEAAYLRHILADITPASASASPFGGIFKQQSPGSGSGGNANTTANLLMKMNQLPGVEECMRMFTAVEVLNGENMVGCRRCWKIANGLYRPKARPNEDCEDSDSDESDKSDSPGIAAVVPQETEDPEPTSSPSSPSVSASMSSSITSLDKRFDPDYDTPQSSLSNEAGVPSQLSTLKPPPPPLPLVSSTPPRVSPDPHPTLYGGMPIPVISTTAPESPGPRSPPTTAKPMIANRNPSFTDHSGLAAALAAPLPVKDSLRAPRGSRHKRMPGDAESTAESAEESSDEALDSDASLSTSMLSDTSSIASPLASPNASPNISLEQLPRRQAKPLALKPSPPKIPRSKQVIMCPAYKRYLIGTPPPILVIHLKRFQQISKSPMMSFSSGFKKLEDFVAFPEDLDIGPFLAPRKEDFGLGPGGGKQKHRSKKPERCMYRLYAVVVHIGNMLGGHYIAYTAVPSTMSKDTPDSQPSISPSTSIQPQTSGSGKEPPRRWAYISDTVVRLATLDEVLKAKAYICMYERI